MAFCRVKVIRDNLIIDTRKLNLNIITELSKLQSYYAAVIPIADRENIEKITVQGLGLSHSLSFAEKTLSEFAKNPDKSLDTDIDEFAKIRILQIHDDVYGRHLKSILELIIPNLKEKSEIILPNHFEAFNKEGVLLNNNDTIYWLYQERDFDRKNSSFLLIVGKSFDEEFKNPIMIFGLTQMKLSYN